MGDGGPGGGHHTAAPPGPGSLPPPPEEDNTGGEAGESPGGSDHLRPRHCSLSSASTVPPDWSASQSIYRESLASQVENVRSVMKWGKKRGIKDFFGKKCLTAK